MLSAFALVVVSGVFVRVSDYEYGTDGVVEVRIVVRDDRTWERSTVTARGSQVDAGGRMSRGEFAATSNAARRLGLAGDRELGKGPQANEHRAWIVGKRGSLHIRQLPPGRGMPLSGILRDAGYGPAAAFVAQVEAVTTKKGD